MVLVHLRHVEPGGGGESAPAGPDGPELLFDCPASTPVERLITALVELCNLRRQISDLYAASVAGAAGGGGAAGEGVATAGGGAAGGGAAPFQQLQESRVLEVRLLRPHTAAAALGTLRRRSRRTGRS